MDTISRLSLPYELLSCIVGLVSDNHDQASLASLSRANRTLHDIVSPVILKHVELSTPHSYQALRSLYNQRLNPFIRVQCTSKNELFSPDIQSLTLKPMLPAEKDVVRSFPLTTFDPIRILSPLPPVLITTLNICQSLNADGLLVNLLGPNGSLRKNLKSFSSSLDYRRYFFKERQEWRNYPPGVINWIMLAPKFIGILEMMKPFTYSESSYASRFGDGGYETYNSTSLERARFDYDYFNTCDYVLDQLFEPEWRQGPQSPFSSLTHLKLRLHPSFALEIIRSIMYSGDFQALKHLEIDMTISSLVTESNTNLLFRLNRWDQKTLLLSCPSGINFIGFTNIHTGTNPAEPNHSEIWHQDMALEPDPIAFVGPHLDSLVLIGRGITLKRTNIMV